MLELFYWLLSLLGDQPMAQIGAEHVPGGQPAAQIGAEFVPGG
jgi:hypothetical protein